MTDMMAEIAAFDGRTAKIVGPARSGKTEALLRRAAAAVAAGCAPEDILIETSTAEAARVARRRLVDALAAALIHSPRVLVLDEPFEAVDPVSAANIRQILTDYTRRGGTVILSSHVMATVQQLCTHVAIIDKGRVLVAGTTDEVAQGGDLGERFTSLVGGVHSEEGLSWLGN